VAVNQQIDLVDMQRVDDTAPIRAMLECPDVTKLLHAASEDIQLLEHCCGAQINNLFDTQIGAAMAGYGVGLGYHSLVAKLFDDDVPKEQTRSDWIKRPLSSSQLEYAAIDTAYLPLIHDQITATLTQLSREQWALADMVRLMDASRRTLEPGRAWRRLKGMDRLSPTAQHRLADLALWREQTAREFDMPRGHVLKDNTLATIARRGSLSDADLKDMEDIHPKTRRRFGTALIAAHVQATEAAAALAREHALKPLVPSLPKAIAADTMAALKSAVATVAQEQSLAPELLASRRDLDQLMATTMRTQDQQRADIETVWPEALQGWRFTVLCNALVPILEKHHG
jgi:ribonuclease D